MKSVSFLRFFWAFNEKIIAVILVVLLFAAVSGCGAAKENETVSTGNSSSQKASSTVETTDPAEAFAEYGLSAIVPADATVVDSDYKKDKYVDCTFGVAVKGDADGERLAYDELFLEELRRASANKRVYVLTDSRPRYNDAPDFTVATQGEYYLLYYFKGKTYCEIKLSDDGDATQYKYRISIPEYYGNNKPGK